MKNEKKRIWWLLVILMLAAGIGAAYIFGCRIRPGRS